MRLKRKLKREFIVTSIITILIELIVGLILEFKGLLVDDIFIAAIGAYLAVMSFTVVMDLIFISLMWVDEDCSYIKLLKSHYFEKT